MGTADVSFEGFEVQLWAYLRFELTGIDGEGNYGGFIGLSQLLRHLSGTDVTYLGVLGSPLWFPLHSQAYLPHTLNFPAPLFHS